MPKLLRFRLMNIGYERARIDDLTFAFHDDKGQAASSVLWLRNGGGKTSLVSLLLWLLYPDTAMPDKERRLEHYVKVGDRSLLALEWQLDDGSKYLTCVFCEGKAAEKDRVRSYFFATQVLTEQPYLTLDDLPVYLVNGQQRERRTMMAFRQEWESLRQKFPHAGVYATERMGKWRMHLAHVGIDSELFRYQIILNQHESDKDERFTFANADKFVEFFLNITGANAIAQEAYHIVDQFKDSLRLLAEELEPQASFIEKALNKLSILEGALAKRQQMYSLIMQAFGQIEQRYQLLTGELGDIKVELENLKQERKTADQTAREKRILADSLRKRNLALQFFACTLQKARLLRQQQELMVHIKQAEREVAIWHSAYPFWRIQRCDEKMKRLQNQIEMAQEARKPLLTDLQEAAYHYACALTFKTAQLQKETKYNDRLVQIARHQQMNASRQASEFRSEATKCHGEAKSVLTQHTELIKLRAQLHEQQILLSEERFEQACERWQQEIARLDVQKERLETRISEIQKHRQQLIDYHGELSQQSYQFETGKSACERQLAEAEKFSNVLSRSPLLAFSLEIEEIDLHRLDTHACEVLRSQVRAREEQRLQCRVLQAEQEVRTSYLTEHQLLPPNQSVLTVIDALHRKQILAAWSGWSYLAENKPASERREFLYRLPLLASGVVVRNDLYEQTCQILRQAHLRLDTVVAVFPIRALDVVEGGEHFCLGPASDAFFNREVGEQEFIQSESRKQELIAQLDGITQEIEDLRRLADQLEEWQQKYPHLWWKEQKQELQKYEQELIACQEEMKSLNEVARREAGELDTLQQEVEALHTQKLFATQAQARLEARADLFKFDPESMSRRYDQLQGKAQDWLQKASDEDEQEASLEAQKDELQGKATEFALSLQAREKERNGITYLDDRLIIAQEGNLSSLESHYTMLKASYLNDPDIRYLDQQIEDAQAEKSYQQDQFRSRAQSLIQIADVEAVLMSEMGEEDIDVLHRCALEELTGWKIQKKTNEDEIGKNQTREADLAQKCQGANVVLQDYEFREMPPEPEIFLRAVEQSERDIDKAQEEARAFEEVATQCQNQIVEQEQQKLELSGLQSRLQLLQVTNDNLLQRAKSFSILQSESDDIDESTDALVARITRLLRNASRTLEELDGQRKNIAHALHILIAASEYKHLTLVQKFVNFTEEMYEERYDTLKVDLETRLEQIVLKREGMEKDRALVIQSIQKVASDGIALLKSATRRSRMPAQLHKFEQRPFLKISIPDITGAEAQARMSQYLDTIIAGNQIPSGVQLLHESVRRLAGKITVDVLFPDPDSAMTYVPIEQAARHSGGERLTGTILLFCTLMQLRSIERTGRDVPSSCLVLDNPFGQASRALFVDIQQEVARARNIQLIYTTGINDYDALDKFPVIIPIQNKHIDRNTGNQMLQLDKSKQTLEEIRLLRRGHLDTASTIKER